LHVAGRPTYRKHSRQQQGGKQRDQRNNDEKFNKRNSSPSKSALIHE
jgi:hypothetical protein